MEKMTVVNGETPANAYFMNKLQDNVEDAINETIKTSKTATDTSGYSCNYINDINTYSANETLTGETWINGKPIYRKVFNGNLGIPITHNIANANFIKIYGYYAGSSGNVFPLPSVRPNYSAYACGIYVNNTQIIFDKGVSLDNNDCVIILEYTKTTD